MEMEETKEQKARRSLLMCICCSHKVPIGPNYPIGVPLPRTLELWCSYCKAINLFNNPMFSEEVKAA